MIRLRQIKPKGFRVEPFKTELDRAGTQVAADVLQDFKRTTATWQHKVTWTKQVVATAGQVLLNVGTADAIYRYVDEGTRPHVIRPRRARMLRFATGYQAKTTPGVIGSGPGGARGPVVYAKAVMHPGTKARGFSKAIAKKWRKPFAVAMQRALDKGAAGSGHKV
jgi:hypothetical protein